MSGSLEIRRSGSSAWTLETSVWLPGPVGEVFPFFADAANLDTITPSWLGFRILTPLPVEMRRGLTLDYRIRIHGVPVSWRTEITEWDPPRGFVDEQRRGPYRSWVHRHVFREQDGGTLILDRVDYRVRGGALVHRLFVRRDVEAIFRHRRQVLLALFAERGGQRRRPAP